MTYVLAAAVVLAVNLLPAFGPPTWSVLVLFRLRSHLNPVALVIEGALAAGLGRFLLAEACRRLRGRLSDKHTANLAWVTSETEDKPPKGFEGSLVRRPVAPLPLPAGFQPAVSRSVRSVRRFDPARLVRPGRCSLATTSIRELRTVR